MVLLRTHLVRFIRIVASFSGSYVAPLAAVGAGWRQANRRERGKKEVLTLCQDFLQECVEKKAFMTGVRHRADGNQNSPAADSRNK